jgi:hypothetical protein
MSAIAIRWLVSLVMSVALAAVSYWAGDHNRNNAWLAKQATVASDAVAEYQREMQRGNDAAGVYRRSEQVLSNEYSTLERKSHDLRTRVPLVVSGTGVSVPSADGGPSQTGCAALDGSNLPGTHLDLAGPVLSNGAVWMWNSSLAGADLSTGACGSADPADPACAAGSGITLGDAWDNQGTNAKSCAADRLRYQHLIDFLKGRNP